MHPVLRNQKRMYTNKLHLQVKIIKMLDLRRNMIVEIRIYIKTKTVYTAEDLANQIRQILGTEAKVEVINYYMTWKDIEYNKLFE